MQPIYHRFQALKMHKKQGNLGAKSLRHRPRKRLTSARYFARYFVVLVLALTAMTVACGASATAVPTASSTKVSTGTEADTPTIPAATPVGSLTADSTATTALDETPNTGPLVRVEDLVFPVELADTPDKRIRGLSGRASMDAGTGMLFVFEKPERFRFWMREMEITLDIVWIGSNCEVVDVSENVPFPDPETPLNDLPRYSPESRAKFVLEINGGEAAELGLGIGDQVEFLNDIAGKYDC